ncbi:cell division membrane protein-like protein [Syntrophobotulus glycolicus DSM 8271]|uniref:Cell division membrane protein-like protein n=1 Tax=Syntrophobotulus glycolicus (strain DSM 8271 / FlGlyR) TaxID=645991 RepID=F0T2W7_SYNGF|nr:FtsW/RodA/SpoVE family cell cycle protein [Syntrophobotulus glycolicus]ADY57604.1 cell division membrane protein-like protein [Syntrophobotulus glycolicus DSM 8271]
MPESEKINKFLETVRGQIRWKKAHLSVTEEIRNHIIDQRDAFIEGGQDETTATEMAIAEMGDPIIVGEQLDRTHRSRPDWPLLVMTIILLLAGLSIQFLVGRDIQDGTNLFLKQAVWTVFAVVILIGAYFLDFTIIGKYPKPIFLGLSILTVVSYFFTGGNGGLFRGSGALYTIYPLLFFPTAFAGFIYSMRSKGYGGIILCGASLIAPAFLSRLVPSLTFYFLLCLSCLIVLTAAIMKNWFKVNRLFALLIIYIPTILVWTIPYLRGNPLYGGIKLQLAFNPFLDSAGAGYLGAVIRRLLANSRFLGEGLPVSDGVSTGLQILPEAHTDFLLTYLIYRFGWIIFIVLMTIFLAFILRSINICKRQHSVLGFLTGLAITLTLSIECMLYILSNLGFLFFAPLSLPLISYGGRALIANSFLIGLLLSLFRTGNLVRDKGEVLVKPLGGIKC